MAKGTEALAEKATGIEELAKFVDEGDTSNPKIYASTVTSEAVRLKASAVNIAGYINTVNHRTNRLYTKKVLTDSIAEKKEAAQSDPLEDALDGVELWHSPEGICYATITRNGHQEHHQVEGKKFRQLLVVKVKETTGKRASKEALGAMIEGASAEARVNGPEYEVSLRMGRHGDNLYLDLGDEDWTIIETTAAGWGVAKDVPIKFRRGGGKPLPMPVKGGSIDLLRPFLNVRDDADFMLVVGVLVAAFREGYPFSILDLAGETGSGKSTKQKLLQLLIDPCVAPGRGLPSNEEDLVVAAYNNWLVRGDNVSSLKPDMADALCRVSTGGGISKREFYTNGEEFCLEAKRPVFVNGINIISARQDLLNRVIVVTLEAIPDDARKTEEDLLTEFDKVRPQILGALLDGVSTALRRLPEVKLDGLPRMADFVKFAEAAGESFGWEPGAFQLAYEAMQFGIMKDAVKSDILASTIVDWLKQGGGFEGSATKMLESLNVFDGTKKQSDYWPKTPTRLGHHLRRIAKGLRDVGVGYEDIEDKSNHSTIYKLEMLNDVF